MTDDVLACIRHILTAPMTITAAEHWVCSPRKVGHETIVWFPKVILVKTGRIQYTIESQTFTIPAGSIFYRPAWTRSRWKSTSRRPLRMAFCEFDIPVAGAMWREPFVIRPASPARDHAALVRISRLLASRSRPAVFDAAGELKALLARTFARLAENRPVPRRTSAAQGALDMALRHIEEHYGEPDVLDDLAARTGMGVNRLRASFNHRLGLSPHEYVTNLRMRAARYYLTDARMAVKQVAATLGYADPLYFSRAYRKFWGHPPTDDRNMPAAGARPPRLP